MLNFRKSVFEEKAFTLVLFQNSVLFGAALIRAQGFVILLGYSQNFVRIPIIHIVLVPQFEWLQYNFHKNAPFEFLVVSPDIWTINSLDLTRHKFQLEPLCLQIK